MKIYFRDINILVVKALIDCFKDDQNIKISYGDIFDIDIQAIIRP